MPSISERQFKAAHPESTCGKLVTSVIKAQKKEPMERMYDEYGSYYAIPVVELFRLICETHKVKSPEYKKVLTYLTSSADPM